MRKKCETVSLFATYPKSTTIATTYCTVCCKELSKTDELWTVAKTTIKTFDDLKAAVKNITSYADNALEHIFKGNRTGGFHYEGLEDVALNSYEITSETFEPALAYIKTFNNTFTYDMIGVIDIEIAAGTVTEVAINGVTYSSAVKVDPSKGYDSWSKMKRDIGSAGDGNEWHHIVEQSQIDKSGFSSKMVNNPDNVVSIPREIHQKITGYYNSKPEFTNGLTYREWLAGQSYETQYESGLEILEKFLRK